MTGTPTVVIGFSGAATIRHAEEFAERLKQALDSADRVEVDCTGVTEVDITFMQLLLSACKSAGARGQTVSLSTPASGALLEAVIICGAQEGPRAHFWLERRAS